MRRSPIPMVHGNRSPCRRRHQLFRTWPSSDRIGILVPARRPGVAKRSRNRSRTARPDTPRPGCASSPDTQERSAGRADSDSSRRYRLGSRTTRVMPPTRTASRDHVPTGLRSQPEGHVPLRAVRARYRRAEEECLVDGRSDADYGRLPVTPPTNDPHFHVPVTNTGVGDFPGGDAIVALGASATPAASPWAPTTCRPPRLRTNWVIRSS